MRSFDEELNNLLSKENVLNALEEIDKLTEIEANELLNFIIERDKVRGLIERRDVLQRAIEEISARDRLKDEILNGRIH